jgi:hypothetical protein
MALLRWIYLRKLVPIEDLIAGTGSAKPDPGRPAVPQVPKRPAPAALSPAERSSRPPQQVATPPAPGAAAAPRGSAGLAHGGSFKDALLAEIRKSKAVFYNTVVAQAQKIEVAPDRVTFTFSATQGALRSMVEQNRAWLESVAQQIAGRKVTVTSTNGAENAAPPSPEESPKADRKSALREQAMGDPGVQALLEVFPVEIRDVEEM